MEENNLVIQSNELIEAHYKQEYSVQEQRTVLWLISRIQRQDLSLTKEGKFKKIFISAIEYAKLMGISAENVYRDAQKIADALGSKRFTIKTLTGWLNTGWIASMEYKKGEAILEAEISPKLLPYLVDLKEKFTFFRLENILLLRSSHAIKIYQFLTQYKKIGERFLALEELKGMLGIKKLPSYGMYNNLKQKVLEISKREINLKTDISIDYEEIKKGRKVIAVKFKIMEKQTQEEQAKKMFKAYIQQKKDETLTHLVKVCFSDEDFFRQNLVAPAFESFLQEKISNYEPKSSKPLQFTEITA